MDNSSVLLLKTSVAINLSLDLAIQVLLGLGAIGPGFNSILPSNSSRYIKHTYHDKLLARLQLMQKYEQFH